MSTGAAARPSPARTEGRWIPPADAGQYTWSGWSESTNTHSRQVRRRIGFARQSAYVAIDIFLGCLGSALVFVMRFGFSAVPGRIFVSASALFAYARAVAYPAYLGLYAALIVLACTSMRLYHTPREISSWRESLAVARAVSLATALLVVFIFVSGNKEISRQVIVSAGVLNILLLASWRYAKREYVLARTLRGVGLSHALIIGAGNNGQVLADWLDRNQQLGFSVCGFLDAHKNGNPRVLGTIPDLRKVVLEKFVDHVFLALPADGELVKQIWVQARELRLNLTLVPELYDGLVWRAPVRSMAGVPVIELHGQPIPDVGLAVKRAMDVVVSAAGLAICAPLLALAAVWIRLDSPGSAIYTAPRMGQKGKVFRCYKLRTMQADADSVKDKLREKNERNGPFFKMQNDPRITFAGQWLRRYSIDELPQLVNVLIGDMSLVGPRPHPLDDCERYTIEHLRRLDVKPGVTGLWQVTARRDPCFEKNMKLDLEYIENWSLRLDLLILLRTIPSIVRAEGR
jgi:exopolysaccharide biosynthesis polyprenyl glycosylphosphotransferase